MATQRMADLILASASPRRKELLAQLSSEFIVRASDIDERLEPGPIPEAVARLALRKARSVARDVSSWNQSSDVRSIGSRALASAVVLAADTVVVVDQDVLGKPVDEREARMMLRKLRGRGHEVVTGVAVIDSSTGRSSSVTVVSRVFMARYGDEVINRYVDSGEPLDKAGAYAIQGLGGELIDGLIGSYSNVVGLPLAETRRLLTAFGVAVSA